MILPDQHGVKTYERLKEVNPEVKVLLTSGYNSSINTRVPIQNARAGFLRKPFNTTALTDSIADILNHAANTP
jgi:DNA-binding NtrC family response regulator